MAGISLTYTLTNGATADASQVMQNFNDIVNGTSDGTKDFSISALTCAGAATLNGNVTLGNASSDDITVTGSLASSIAIKTTATYNIGAATLGLLSIYLGRNSQSVRIIGSSSMSATWTLTLPTTAGTSRYALTTDGSGTTSWTDFPRDASWAGNYSIACSVATNALTIALKDQSGSDATSTTPIEIYFRSSTAATGTRTLRTVTAALSTTISSGSTAGHTSAKDEWIYVYAIDNAGTVELAWSSLLFDEGTRQTTTAEGGAGAADSGTTLYSTTARTNVAIRLLGRLISTQTTAGTWAAVPTEIASGDFYTGTVHLEVSGSTTAVTASTDSGPVSWTTTHIDTHSAFSSGTTFTCPFPGLYRISAGSNGPSAAQTVGLTHGLVLDINGASTKTVGFSSVQEADTFRMYVVGSRDVFLNAGDTLRLYINPSVTGNLPSGADNTWMTITRIGGKG